MKKEIFNIKKNIKLPIPLNVVVLTGAGISAESGINTFRDKNGLWETYSIEEYGTTNALKNNRDKVLDFFKKISNEMEIAEPNLAHLALAELENKNIFESFHIITQNIDLLHEKAGSKNVTHVHGNIEELKCEKCNKIFKRNLNSESIKKCKNCGSEEVRPNITLFGDIIPNSILQHCQNLLTDVDLFVSIGTSGEVYPVANFINDVLEIKQLRKRIDNERQINTVELNLSPSLNYQLFDQCLFGKATETVPNFFRNLLLQHRLIDIK